MGVIFRQPWTRQPQQPTRAAQGGGLFDKLVLAVAPGIDLGLSSGGSPNNILRVVGGGSTAGATSVGGGVAGAFDGSNSRIQLQKGLIHDGDVTFFALVNHTTIADCYMICSGYDGANEPLAFRLNGGTCELRTFAPNAGCSFINGFPVGRLTSFYGRVTPAGVAGNWDAGSWDYGKRFSDTVSTIGVTRAGANWWIGCGDNAGTPWRFFNSNIYVAAAWNRRLTDGELDQVEANPWQLFTPVSRRLYFDLGAPAGITDWFAEARIVRRRGA